MSSQNINQYNHPKLYPLLSLDTHDMSLTSDERGFNQEVVFSPYLIAETFGDKLPINIDLNSESSSQNITLSYKNYDKDNVVISQNYYNPKNLDLSCQVSGTSCDIGLTGIDNGLVDLMSGQTIIFTNGLLNESEKFDRLKFDRRFKMFQVTGNTNSPNIKFSGFDKTVLYEMITKNSPFEGRYNELYGGFYQGFYKLFGYDYEIFPERMNKGWSVEMVLKPRLINEYTPSSGETTLNEIYPNNKNTFFYFGTRAENKFNHHASGYPKCLSGYTRVTSGLTNLETCACCNRTITNSRCIYVYPPRSNGNVHDPHVNYGCGKCNGNPDKKISCGCNCNDKPCETCGWECQTHKCDIIIEPTPTPTPTPAPTNTCNPTPVCTPSCTKCETCDTCDSCTTGFTSIENTCESDPLWDSLSNNLSFRLCGDPKNPQIGVRVLKLTGDCQTTGTCVTGQTYVTGHTVFDYCTPQIYPYCERVNPSFLDEEHWFQINVVWERNTFFDECDLRFKGGLDDITKKIYLESLANNTVSLITVPYTHENGETPEKIELVQLNETWLKNKKYRKGKLKIYINGKLFHTIDDFEEVIPRGLNTDKERQVGVPFNISWGGGTQGLRENLTFTSLENLNGPYIQDPENLPNNDLSGTSLSSLTTNILIEQNFAGTFEGAISQFRMYVTPMSASEVKHNFKILQKVFRMFNPDCPDCSTTTCEVNDFTYTINDDTTTTTTTTPPVGEPNPFGLGRELVIDERDKKYLIENKLQLKKTTLTEKYWFADGWWGDQGNTPHCVGYSWSHWIDDGPILHKGPKPNTNPILIYREAQKIDEWPGENYAGTSVRAGAKFLKSKGKIKEYLWTTNLTTLVNTVLTQGPVVVGTNWYYGMFFPDRNGMIRVTGRISGGHAYLINGVDTKKQIFRIKNSWGRTWGQMGHAYISFSDMNRLMREQGEVCLAIENNF
jgi:hypothetical protein